MNQKEGNQGHCTGGQKQNCIVTVGKVVRAVGAIVFFGVPAVALTTVLLGYGAHRLYKRICS
ncbi:MAG TPA: hypothetical protein V6C97_00235 [Oculatellaceae cyanobacterium]|nr:hypothetical protein [Syntrophorhabdaceae bacterium]